MNHLNEFAFNKTEWKDYGMEGETLDLAMWGGSIEELMKELGIFLQKGYKTYSINVRMGYYDVVDGLDFEVSKKIEKKKK